MKLFYLLLLSIFISACGFPELFPKPEKPQAVSLKIINYNLWHGLGEGFLKRKVLEPETYKKQRLQWQINQLKQEKPDVLFLQEANPVSSLFGGQSREIAKKLGMSYIFQNTNCGVSVLGFGPPVNLNMGIAILVRPPLKIKKILGLKLSGPFGDCNPYLTFQLSEFRYALFALAYHPDYGSFLLVNTHFHHGVEWSPQVREQINDWEKTGLLTFSQKTELENAIESSNQRREKELKNLFSQVKEIQEHYEELPIILAGDFNSTVQSPIYKKIIETYKLKDSAENHSPQPYTWNPLENKKNHQYTAKANFSVVPTFDKKEVETFFKEYDNRPRRIDYVFVSQDIQILSHSLFDNQPNDQGIIGSDHFGVLVLMNIKKGLPAID